MQRNRFSLAVLALALVVVAGCSAANTPAPVALLPTKTPKPTFTPTVVATAIRPALPTATVLPTQAPTQAPTATVALTPTPAAPQVSAAQNVNVRQGPGTNYPIIGQLKAGNEYKVTGQNDSGTWIQINYDGDPGWVTINLVTVTGDTNAIQVAENIPAPPPTSPPPPAPAPAPAQPVAQPAQPAPAPAPAQSSYPFRIAGNGKCEPNEGTTYFNGYVRYPNNSPRNGVCVHIAFYGPRQTKCSGCGGVGDGVWGFSPFGGSKPQAGTTVEIYVVQCPAGMPTGGQDENTGFGNLTPQSDKWVHTLKGGEQCTGITFVGD